MSIINTIHINLYITVDTTCIPVDIQFCTHLSAFLDRFTCFVKKFSICSLASIKAKGGNNIT